MIVAAALTVLGLIMLRPGAQPEPSEAGGFGAYDSHYRATIVSNLEIECAGTDSACRLIAAEFLEGPDVGTEVDIVVPEAQLIADVAEGSRVVVGHIPGADEGFEYAITDRDRRGGLLLLVAIFAAVVVIFGRLRGLASLVALGLTVAFLTAFIVPAILSGRDPLLTAVVGSAAIAFVSLYLSHGRGPKTAVALLGTLAGLTIAAVLAVAFTGLTQLTGFATDEAFFVQALSGSIDVRGLLLAGMIIGALGVIDDATVTQAEVIWELHEVSPDYARRRLFSGGLRIGSAHIASMVNTLVLAYAGAAMPVIVLIALSDDALGTVLNGEIVATEIVRTLVGSIGLVAAIPITTVLAVWAVGVGDRRLESRGPKSTPEPQP